MKKNILLFVIMIGLVSCDFLDPLPVQDQTTKDLWSHANFGEGLLTNAYRNLSSAYPVYLDFYTDNAVPNLPGNNNLALGNWTLEGNSLGGWAHWYDNIKYLNLFIENSEDLLYRVSDSYRDSTLRVHRTGEAFFLRAWYQAQLLQYYAGPVGNEMYGFPIVTKSLTLDDDLDIPRAKFEDCVAQIVEDLDTAFDMLPLNYTGSTDYDGPVNRGRASGLAAKTLKARVYLMAASPAYGNSSIALWQRAAEAAAEAINAAGGLVDLTAFGNFNNQNSLDNIWIQPTYTGNGWEYEYYPPSLYGTGYCNPSQNLVDAFPAKDGFPIGASAIYSANQPYENRDPRFNRFIFYNDYNYNGTRIQTFEGGRDAPGGLNQQGTRTGYYMKKLLSYNVRLTPGDLTADVKFYIYLGKTELYLNFAEAANEAFGPNDATYGFSAADVMKRIRLRAGIDSDEVAAGYQDQYLDDQANAGTGAFRTFIHNERRLELAFEGFRFWDIRRLGQSLNHTIRGVKVTRNGGDFDYEYVDVENHTFRDHMRYVPLPFSQTLMMSNLSQNDGWN